MTPELWGALVTTVAAIIAAFFGAPFLMRRVNRDLTSAQTRAIHVDDEEQTFGLYTKAMNRLNELDEYQGMQDHAHMLHGAWDFQVIQLAAEHGYVLPPCPPLRPPLRVRVRDIMNGDNNVS